MPNTTTQPELGLNRTGTAASPRHTRAMVTGTTEFQALTGGDEREIALERGDYARDADPLGSVPLPVTIKGAISAATTMLKGENALQLIDKLGERIAFERSGTRLYEGLIAKHDALGGFEGGPNREDLENIALEEHRHFVLLESLIEKLGADPTVMTPSADLHATMTRGVLEVVVDPRTSLAQCLEAALVAELADNECWSALQELAEEAGEQELAEQCSRALRVEAEHLTRVRAWIAAAQGRGDAV